MSLPVLSNQTSLQLVYESPDEPNETQENNPIDALEIKKKIHLARRDLRCLREGRWLSDTVINAYLRYLKIQYPDQTKGFTNTFFYEIMQRDGPASALKWEGIDEQPITRYSIFLIPISIHAHWILLKVKTEEKRLIIYDSIGNRHTSIIRNVKQFLSISGLEGVRVSNAICHHQKNNCDCGIFVLEWARCIFQGIPTTDVTQSKMPAARKRIRKELNDLVGPLPSDGYGKEQDDEDDCILLGET